MRYREKPKTMVVVSLVAITLLFQNCSGEGGGSSSSSPAANQAVQVIQPAPTTTTMAPNLYCADAAGCVSSCLVAYPYVSASVLSDFCSKAGMPSATCSQFTAANNANAAGYTACANGRASDVTTNPVPLNSVALCGSGVSCANLCAGDYPVQAQSAIDHHYGSSGASGAYYQATFENDLLVVQYNACLSQTPHQVIWGN